MNFHFLNSLILSYSLLVVLHRLNFPNDINNPVTLNNNEPATVDNCFESPSDEEDDVEVEQTYDETIDSSDIMNALLEARANNPNYKY